MDLLKRAAALIGAVLLVLAVYFVGPGDVTQPPTDKALPPELAEEPDVYLRDATITEFATTGSRKYRLHASRMDRFDRDNLTRLTDPVLNMSNVDAPPWDVLAQRGVITRNDKGTEDVVQLNDDVVLKQLDDAGTATELTIRSSALTVHPHRQYAETDQDVMIDSEVGRTLASGMQGDLKQGLLFLSSDAAQPVHTIVLPQQFKETQSEDTEEP